MSSATGTNIGSISSAAGTSSGMSSTEIKALDMETSEGDTVVDIALPRHDVLVEEEITNRSLQNRNIQAGTPINFITFLETVYLALMWMPLTIMFKFGSIFKELKTPGNVIAWNTADVILHPTQLPLAFYTIVMSTMMFGMGVFMTCVTIWSRDWSFSYRYIAFIIGLCAVTIYGTLVAHYVPQFAVGIYVLVLLGIVFVIWFMARMIYHFIF